ncbi:TIGR03757 family integrating conjugative element protein [Pasteurella skyensis]|uniref:TIGR03757 family integrating conjugative element protein n=1 Tax=Phocoenobacter skyensis TaxID=97481 RepID=UPI00275D4C35|nr:TIGR03757 family integrating conjugative element protein [Pasteurella skyensis]MDP8189058.1 TIGR03757 family integrating conjugative element protein [Pasteurella skyensis]
MRICYIMGVFSLFPSILWANSPYTSLKPKITVFTTQAYTIQQSELANNIFFIDSVENIENALANRLNTNPKIAEQQVKKLFNSEEGKKYQEKLQKAYIGLTEAWKIGVMKVPAIVFDNGETSNVIYGETNLSNAIKLYRSLIRE